MSLNIDALFQHLMKDPDIIPPDGENKEDIAMALATQRAKQSSNNEKALNLAKDNNTVSKLLYFLKAEDEENPEFGSGSAREVKQEVNTAEFNMHDKNFQKYRNRVFNARKQGKEPEWDTIKTGDRKGQLSTKGRTEKDEWEAAYEYLGEIEGYKLVDEFDDILSEALEEQDTGETQEVKPTDMSGDPEVEVLGDTEGEGGTGDSSVGSGKGRGKRKGRGKGQGKGQGTSENLENLAANIDNIIQNIKQQEQTDAQTALDEHGHKPGDRFHVSNFSQTSPTAYQNVHRDYNAKELNEAYAWYIKPTSKGGGGGKPEDLNYGKKKTGVLMAQPINNMMDLHAQAKGTSPSTGKSPTPSTPSQQSTSSNPNRAIQMTQINRDSDWYDDNVPDTAAWDKHVQQLFRESAEAARDNPDSLNLNEDTPEARHLLNTHLHAYLTEIEANKPEGKGRRIPPPPQMETPPPDVQREIAEASQMTDATTAIEEAVDNNVNAIVDNPDLNPNEKIDQINAVRSFGAGVGDNVGEELNLPSEEEVLQELGNQASKNHTEAQGGDNTEKKTDALNTLNEIQSLQTEARVPVISEDPKVTTNQLQDKVENLNENLSHTSTSMSKNARTHLEENGIDPDSADVSKVQNIRHAREHVDRINAAKAATEEQGQLIPVEEPPVQLSDLDALKRGHDELEQEFTQLQAQEAHAKEQLKKVKGVVSEEVAVNAELTELKQEKARVRKARREQQAKIAAHPDNPGKEVTPTEETSDEAPTPESESESTEGSTADTSETADTPESGTTDGESGEADPEPVDTPAPAEEPTPREGQQRLDLPRPGAAERRAAQPWYDREGAGEDDAAPEREPEGRQLGLEGQLEFPGMPRAERATPTETTEEGEPQPEGVPEGQLSFDDYRQSAAQVEDKRREVEAREAAKRQPSAIDNMRQQLKDKFNQEHAHVDALSDEEVAQDHKQYQQDLNRQRARNQINTGHSKEDVLHAMATLHGKGGNEEYIQGLRDQHQFDDVKEVTKTYKEQAAQHKEFAHQHRSNDAISSALNMDELPEGSDKLHAMDRVRDIAKKMNDNQMVVDRGGKPILDSNAISHLKSLMDDAVNMGDLSDDEINGIGHEAIDMGEDFYNDEHKADIEQKNEKHRADHKDYVAHVEDMSEEALQQRGEGWNHSKAHELHEYEQDEETGKLKRTGSSHHYREEDGSVGYREGGGSPDSADDAVEGMEAGHPPKLLGLSANQKLEQNEHLELMKKAAAGKLEEGDFDRFKALEANNPALAAPKYKGQVLGAVRHQLSGEDGADTMNAMGIDEADHDEAAESSCRPPAGGIALGGGDKAWNPATHRWCDKEYLESLKGQLGSGEALHLPDGLHAGTEHAHLDQDADGNVQGVMVTPTGVVPVNPSTGMKSSEGGAVSHADVLGELLKDHPGGKVDKKILHASGMNHSSIHTSEGQTTYKHARDKAKGILTNVSGTPGGRMLQAAKGKFGKILAGNKKREEGKPNATAINRQQARRGTDGSPIKSVLSRMGEYTKDHLKDAALDIGDEGGIVGLGLGPLVRQHPAYQKRKVEQAVDRMDKNNKKSAELSDLINTVREERAK